jgi:hypothetical protein
MNPLIHLQKVTDTKFGKQIRIMTDKELIGVVLSDGSFEPMTNTPILPYILKEIVMVSENFVLLFNNIQP